MSELAILNLNLEKVDSVNIDESISSSNLNPYAVKNSVVSYLASIRSGNHKTKQRSEVSYSTRKLYRQKGTGNARAGSAKSPIRRHGGTIFGPVVRDHSIKINRKEKRLALKSILAHTQRNNQLMVFDNFNLASLKTSVFVAFLKRLKIDKCVLVVTEFNENLMLATRNLKNIKVVTSENINVFDIMKYQNLLVTKEALQSIEARLLK